MDTVNQFLALRESGKNEECVEFLAEAVEVSILSEQFTFNEDVSWQVISPKKSVSGKAKVLDEFK